MANGHNGGAAKRILPWVPLALVAIGAAAGWGANSEAVDEHERRLQLLEKAVNEQAGFNGTIDERTKATQKSVDETKKTVNTIETDIKTILRTLGARTPNR